MSVSRNIVKMSENWTTNAVGFSLVASEVGLNGGVTLTVDSQILPILTVDGEILGLLTVDGYQEEISSMS